jgi:hypothetical protein
MQDSAQAFGRLKNAWTSSENGELSEETDAL